MPSFSERHGYSQPKGITYRGELPVKLRIPIFEILERGFHFGFLWKRINALLNPYGTDDAYDYDAWIPAAPGEDDKIAKRVFLTCPWFRVYDVIEDIFDGLVSYYRTFTDEQYRLVLFQQEINDYFKYVGIGWQLVTETVRQPLPPGHPPIVEGKIVARGDEVFEDTVKTAVAVLEEDAKPTAARHLRFAISALSTRPKANTSGAVAHATSAVECVLGEITGQATTLGKYLDKNATLFHPALKKGLDGIYGYASDEGARHGKEGTEPAREEAEFAVAVCAAVCTLLTRKRPE
jgi:hypothetical protein